jgi:PTS system nitrogen regulatory IIA component
MARGGVFISYSHADRLWLERFHTQLKPLVRRGLVLWDDTHLAAGSRWRAEIGAAIARSSAALLLVSPDFLASDFIQQSELEPLLRAQTDTGLVVLWVHLRACLYDQTAIGTLQGAHDVAQPLDSLTPATRGATIARICRRVQDAAMPAHHGAPGGEPDRGATAVESEGDPGRVRYALVLSGQVVEHDKPLVDALLAQLQAIARDSRLTLIRVESGSIKLTLEGSCDGFDRVQQAFVDGDLARATGRDVFALYPVDRVAVEAAPSRTPPHAVTVGPAPPRGLPSSNRLGVILGPDDVLVDVDATSKKHVFETAGLHFEARHGIARATVTDNLFARERLGSTGLGHGVAIPHGRIRGLRAPLSAVLRTRATIPYDAPDDEPVNLLIFLLVPEIATERHLAILSEIADMLSSRDFRERLRTEPDPTAVFELIFRWAPFESAA